MSISDKRMDELIQQARNAATISAGGGDGTPYREQFSVGVYQSTLAALIANAERENKEHEPNQTTT
jgi:hypothetical protein